MAEMLRNLGRFVEAQNSYLIHLEKTRKSITFRYRDNTGVEDREEWIRLAAHRAQQEAFRLRGKNRMQDLWDGIDR